jgi:hypothetical protein
MLHSVCVCSGATSAFVRSYMTKNNNSGMYAGGVPNLIIRQLAISVNQACKMSVHVSLSLSLPHPPSKSKLYTIVTLGLRLSFGFCR